jgi:hypothetical protein
MQCILYKIYFWKVFHKYYNLIRIFICTPICTKFYSCKKWVLQFPILEKCGIVAYKLDLSPSLAGVHDIFHVSQLKKCLKAPVDVMLSEVTPLEADSSYPE